MSADTDHDEITVAEANDMAQAMNEYNARVSKAVDEALICLARWAIKIVGGALLGLYAIGAVWGGS